MPWFVAACIACFPAGLCLFRTYGLYILDTVYLKYDFPVIELMLVLLNVYYLSFYFYRQWRKAEKAVVEIASPPVTAQVSNSGNDQKGKEVFIVQCGAKSIPL